MFTLLKEFGDFIEKNDEMKLLAEDRLEETMWLGVKAAKWPLPIYCFLSRRQA